MLPSDAPSVVPSFNPTFFPSFTPSAGPTGNFTESPSEGPTNEPTTPIPTVVATDTPTIFTTSVTCIEGCVNDASWIDTSGETCEWYEQNEGPLCPGWWWFSNSEGKTAEEACCWCQWDCCENLAPTDWVDDFGTLCQWYVDNEPAGCPQWFDYPGFSPEQGPLTAGEACCHCACEDWPVGGPGIDWVDDSGVTCDWYTQNEPPGCPKWGTYPGTNGVTAAEACCQCRKPLGDGFTDPPTASPTFAPIVGTAAPSMNPTYEGCVQQDWFDAEGYNCSWYEEFEKPGCDLYWWYYETIPDGDSTTIGKAEENCCHCEFDRCTTDTSWVDNDGFNCTWYEDNENFGCSLFRSFPGTGGVAAADACCWCNCRDRIGWTDVYGNTCEFYQNVGDRFCNFVHPNSTSGEIASEVYGSGDKNIELELTAAEACCHCRPEATTTPGGVIP
jgi:hypothetical protein